MDSLPPNSYAVFLRRLARGVIILRILWIFLVAISAIMAFLLYEYGWSAAAFLASACIMFAILSVNKRFSLAAELSSNPLIVYWVHPSNQNSPYADQLPIECSTIKLHLRNGCDLEVDLPLKDMREFLAWLRKQNPSIRVGPYE